MSTGCIGCVIDGRDHSCGYVETPADLEYTARVYDDEPTVCPVHLRFIPCRRCKQGEEQYSTDPADVERTREYQSS